MLQYFRKIIVKRNALIGAPLFYVLLSGCYDEGHLKFNNILIEKKRKILYNISWNFMYRRKKWQRNVKNTQTKA